ncbi:MAG: gliding motility lipoprotein GldH [Bacteroidetes bacterium]|nr:gliding motility lipoprotein GldH [Bacteroidota bacterium]
MSRYIVYIILPVLFLFFISCDRGRLYDRSFSVADQIWHMDSAMVFSVEVDDSLSLYRFYLNIRHNTDYPFSNIFLFLDTRFPNGNTARDTLECILADKQGRWYGTGGGRIRDNQILIREGLKFPRNGEYLFKITQGMRETGLEGMEDVGIRIEKM